MDSQAIIHEMTFTALPDDPAWLARFHAGERGILEQCYRDHFRTAFAAAARILSSVDAETVTHEVFYRLLSDAKMRRGFAGGSLGGWVARVTTNAAIDLQRRRSLEVAAEEHAGAARVDDEIEARILVERFCQERLPEKYKGVFEARFLRQLPQRDAARELGLPRSTLAYQEQQIRALLSDFLLRGEGQ